MKDEFVLVEKRMYLPGLGGVDAYMWQPIHATFTGRRMVSSKGNVMIEIVEEFTEKYGFLRRKKRKIKKTRWIYDENIRTWKMEDTNAN